MNKHLVQAPAAAALLFLAACGGSSGAGVSPASGQDARAASAAPASASAAASAQAKPAASEPLKLTMATASLSASFSIPWIADATGAFAKRGLSVSMPFMEQTPAAFAAMVAGEVNAMEVSAAPVITANVNGKLDLVYVASIMNHPQFALYVGPSIKTAEDLKGKVLATDQPYFPNDYGMQIALSKLKLKASDVQLRRIGSTDKEWAALSSKQVDGAILSPPFAFTAEKAGYHVIADTFDVPYQNVGIVMPRSRIDSLTPALMPMLLAIREAIQTYNTQADAAMKIISERTKETDPEILKKTYEFYKTQAPWEPSLQPTLPGIQGMMDFLAGGTPEIKNTKPEQYVDLRLLQKLG
ncbi:MAG TPA: ABC transporter substrate-binding protein [Chloroflexota bacterium]|nr:ABC transporter substrate-binding protein [Chloroflexota bacterium]